MVFPTLLPIKWRILSECCIFACAAELSDALSVRAKNKAINAKNKSINATNRLIKDEKKAINATAKAINATN